MHYSCTSCGGRWTYETADLELLAGRREVDMLCAGEGKAAP